MKKIIAVLFSALFMIGLTTGAYAAEKELSKEPKITKVYKVTENGLKQISIEKYLSTATEDIVKKAKEDCNNKIMIKDNESISPLTVGFYYDESGHATFRKADLGGRCSIILENRTSSSADYSISYSKTQRYQLNTSLIADELSAVKAGMSFTWVSSSTTNENATLHVRPNHQSWWEFEPLMNNSWGILYYYDHWGDMKSQKFIDVWTPKKIGSKLDGYLIAVEQKI